MIITPFDWVLIGIIAAALVGVAIWKIVEFCRMTPEQKQETVKQWLISAVVAAEAAITTPGAGQEKMKMVVDEFNKHAPMLCKIIMWTTKTASLEELIEQALAAVKENFSE